MNDKKQINPDKTPEDPAQLVADRDYTPYPDGENDVSQPTEEASDKEKFNPLRAFAALFGFDAG